MYAVHMHKELYSGVLHKCGGKRKTWHKRYMILRNDYCLYYYKDTAKGHLGVISLRDPHLKVRQGEKSDCSWPKAVTNMEFSLVIVTSPRTYFMYADSRDEAEEWKRVLQTAHDLLRENAFKANKLVTRSSLVSISSASESSEGSSPKEDRQNGTPAKSNGITKGAEPVPLEESINDSSVSLSMEESGATTVPQTATNDALIPGVEAIYDLAHAEETPPQLKSEDVCTESYEQMDPVKRQNDDQPLPVYEPVDSYAPNSPISASIKNQPLPPIPVVTQHSSQIYDDIVDKNQPLYEDVEDAASSSRRFGQHRDCVVEANNSGDEEDIRARSRSPLPPLPPKDGNIPPLPPKDVDIPPVPPKDTNSPPISPRGTSAPPLPSKENGEKTPSPQTEGKAVSSGFLVTKDERKSPPSPRKPSPSPRMPRKGSPPSPRHAVGLDAVPTLPPKSPESERKKVTPADPTLSSSLAGSSAQKRQVEGRGNRATELNAKTSYLPPLPPKSPSKERKADTSFTNGVAEHWDSEAVYDEVEFEEIQESSTHGHGSLSPLETGKGVILFKRRQVHIAQHSETEVKKRTESVQMLEEVNKDPVLSPTEKVLFAETLREVEHERLLASEERFRWERERMKLEEERRQFEEEKRKLQEELEKTKHQLQNS